MNIPQTSYSQYFTAAILGMQAIAGEVARKISRIASGIIYYGRAIVQSRLYDGVCRMPRSNKFTQAFTGTMSAGSVKTVITSGKIKNGDVDASTADTTIETDFSSDLATTMGLHAAAIKAAMADCFSCAYATGTLTYIGDCDDITAVTTTLEDPGSGDTGAAGAASITTADVVADIIGYAYLTHDRQQQISGVSYYMDTEPVNIMQGGTIWVYAEEAVTPAGTPYARLITNSTKYAGYVGVSSDSSKCVAQTGSKFQESTAAAGLVPFTVNLPQ